MMNKVFVFAVVACVFAVASAVTQKKASVNEFCGEFVRWDLVDGLLTISGTGDMYDFCDASEDPESSLVFPPVPWEDIEDPIDMVVIDEGVTSVGACAFTKGASENIKNITIAASVERIGYYPFGGDALTSIIVKSDNPFYFSENGILYDRNQTTIIRFPKGKSDHSFDIPGTVKTIGSGAFSECRNLTRVGFPEGLTTIAMGAFVECYGLTYVEIPDSVTYIGDLAFTSCHMKSVKLGNNIKTIGAEAFCECHMLEDLSIPDSVTSIGSYAFSSCSKLETVVIPEQVTFIGNEAFAYCGKLTSVYYQGLGSENISTDLFEDDGELSVVCVPPDYVPTQFGGVDVTHDLCRNYTKQFNKCFKGIPNPSGDGYVSVKRRIVKDWEKHFGDCANYFCDNDFGIAAWMMCNSTESVSKTCVNDKCVENWELKEWSVRLEMKDTKYEDFVFEDLAAMIGELSGLNPEDIAIGVVTDGNRRVKTVTLEVGDQKTAQSLYNALENLCGDDQEHGVLCHTEGISIIQPSEHSNSNSSAPSTSIEMSGASTVKAAASIFVMALLLAIKF